MKPQPLDTADYEELVRRALGHGHTLNVAVARACRLAYERGHRAGLASLPTRSPAPRTSDDTADWRCREEEAGLVESRIEREREINAGLVKGA